MGFDTVIIGQVCLDTNTDFDGRTEHRYGGAVLYSGHAANSIGKRVAVVPKGNPSVTNATEAFKGTGITVFERPSRESTLMENVYFTADRERRRSRCLAVIDPYTPADIPDVETGVYHLAGLCYGDIGTDIIMECARRGDVAMDIQCMLRHVEPDQSLKLHDWPEKKEFLKYIRYLKTDAAEAEILTGLTDREEAAKLMYSWGAKEIVITHKPPTPITLKHGSFSRLRHPRHLGPGLGPGYRLQGRIFHSPAAQDPQGPRRTRLPHFFR